MDYAFKISSNSREGIEKEFQSINFTNSKTSKHLTQIEIIIINS